MEIESSHHEVIFIGYSGHGYVAIDALLSSRGTIRGYCEMEMKSNNPFNLPFLGRDETLLIDNQNWFIAIGDNAIRSKIYLKYQTMGNLITIKHRTSVVGYKSEIGKGSLLAAYSTINPLCTIGKCCIINTGAIVEHECQVEDFAHIAPGAVLAGNVTIGQGTFVGANSVIKQGVKIGTNVVIGAGAVVLNNIPDNVVVVGNPGKIR
jgi:sugar O-acyltransferase (sialic acid O-acetyltransferase NeuD family)